MPEVEICSEKCMGCTHQGYLCRQFEFLVRNQSEILKTCDSIERDIHESDKVYIHLSRIRGLIGKKVGD